MENNQTECLRFSPAFIKNYVCGCKIEIRPCLTPNEVHALPPPVSPRRERTKPSSIPTDLSPAKASRDSPSQFKCCPKLKCQCGVDWKTEFQGCAKEPSSSIIISHLPCKKENCNCELRAPCALSAEVIKGINEALIEDKNGGATDKVINGVTTKGLYCPEEACKCSPDRSSHSDDAKSSALDNSIKSTSVKSDKSLLCPYGADCSCIKDNDFMKALHFSNEKLNVTYRVQSDHDDVATAVVVPPSRVSQRSKSSKSTSFTPTTVVHPYRVDDSEMSAYESDNGHDVCACDVGIDDDLDACACDISPEDSWAYGRGDGFHEKIEYPSWKTRPLEMKEHLFCPPDRCTCITWTPELEALMAEPVGAPFVPSYKRLHDDTSDRSIPEFDRISMGDIPHCLYDHVPCLCTSCNKVDECDCKTPGSESMLSVDTPQRKSVRIKGDELPPPNEPILMCPRDFSCDCTNCGNEKCRKSQMPGGRASSGVTGPVKNVCSSNLYGSEHPEDEIIQPTPKSFIGKALEPESSMSIKRADTPVPWSTYRTSSQRRSTLESGKSLDLRGPFISDPSKTSTPRDTPTKLKCPRDFPCNCVDCKKEPKSMSHRISDKSDQGDRDTVASIKSPPRSSGRTVDGELSRGTKSAGSTPKGTVSDASSKPGNTVMKCPQDFPCDCVDCMKNPKSSRISEVSKSSYGEPTATQSSSRGATLTEFSGTLEPGATSIKNTPESVAPSGDSLSKPDGKVSKCPRDFPCNCVDCKKKTKSKSRKTSDKTKSVGENSTPKSSTITSEKSGANGSFSTSRDSTVSNQPGSRRQTLSSGGTLLAFRGTSWGTQPPRSIFKSEPDQSDGTSKGGQETFGCCDRTCPAKNIREVSCTDDTCYEKKRSARDESNKLPLSGDTPDSGQTSWNAPEPIDATPRATSVTWSRHIRDTPKNSQDPPSKADSAIPQCPRDFPCDCIECKKKPKTQSRTSSGLSKPTHPSISESSSPPITPLVSLPPIKPSDTLRSKSGSVDLTCPHYTPCDCVQSDVEKPRLVKSSKSYQSTSGKSDQESRRMNSRLTFCDETTKSNGLTGYGQPLGDAPDQCTDSTCPAKKTKCTDDTCSSKKTKCTDDTCSAKKPKNRPVQRRSSASK